MGETSIDQSTMPWDKSWGLRCGVLDIVHGQPERAIHVLDSNPPLSDDLVALREAAWEWDKTDVISVGESGTLYRFLQYVSWQQGLNKQFMKSGTLQGRGMSTQDIVMHRNQAGLLLLDNETSQWASAAALCGDPERLPNPPFKLATTYEAIDHWNQAQAASKPWELRKDATITAQAVAFQGLLKGLQPNFEPVQAEDFPFARVFDYMTTDEAKKRWRSLAGHESNRFEEVDAMLALAEQGEPVPTRDHRIAQAIIFWGKITEREVEIIHPECISKSWPVEQFDAFLKSLT